jgi:hypothetical protein
MKKISECNYQFNQPFVDSNPKFTDEDYKIVNDLFLIFQSIFPAFKQSWPTETDFENAKREWLKAFKYAKLTEIESIKRGVNKFRISASPFVPSPGQFISMCNPTAEELGLPPVDTAYKEACYNSHPTAQRKWSHPAVEHACKQTGFHELSTLSQLQSKPLFERNYEITCRMILEGKPLTEINLGIEKDDQKNEGVILEQYKNISNAREAFSAMMAKCKSS